MSRRLSKNRRLPHTAWNWTADALERRIFLATHPLTSIPVLNSDPGAPATIYLDFHGEPAMTWGQYSVPTTPAYDTDGDPTTFSDTELASIQQIWARVAEAYSPFNINVTTVDPGNWGWGGNHQYRIIIGGSGSWQSSGEGGAAYVGGFAQNYAPDTAFVFSSNLGGSPLYVGDDAVHEGGHGMGLDHQSAYSGTTRTQMYNPGNGTTSPFMGLPWGAPRATWWDGQSELGYNIYQDDLAIISNSTNGFGYRPLLYGQSAGTASVLSVSNNAFSASGIIENTSQQDYFSLSVPNSGSDTFTVNVAQYGAMLHAQLELLNSSGTLITDADSASTLGQSITANLTAGNYYLVVKSYGQYGDIGQYTLSGTLAAASSTPVLAISGAASVNELASYTLGLSANDPGQTISSWQINWGDGSGIQTVSGNPSSVTHTFAAGPHTFVISASATDGTGTYRAGNTQSVSVLHVPPVLSISGQSAVYQAKTYSLNLSASDPGHTVQSWSINWGDGSAVQTVSGNPSTVTHTFASPANVTISATATDDVATYSAGNTVAVAVNAPPTISIGGTGSVRINGTYTLTLSATEPAGQTVSGWSINWGDGGAVQTAGGSTTSLTYTFTTAGSYTVTASTTDAGGMWNSNSLGVTVLAMPVFTINGAISVYEQTAYTLNLSASDPGQTVSSWAINWGDGSSVQTISGNPSSVNHTFAVGPNSYVISATATDALGTYNAGNTQSLSVLHVPPVLSISGQAAVYQAKSYALNLFASDPNHTIQSWAINWGDGTAVQSVSGNPSSVTHTFASAASVTISATATDNVSTYAAGNTVAVTVDAPPTITISGSAEVRVARTYTLSLSASEPAGMSLSSWAINWGDGSSVQSVAAGTSSATHTFAAVGSYTISATATDSGGVWNSNSLGASVTPIPTFTISGNSSVYQQKTYTLDLAANDAHTVSSWQINWGDGSAVQTVSGSPSSVTHTFALAGNVSISISASASDDVSTYAAGNTVAVTVNPPPTITIGGAGAVMVNGSYTLSLSASEPAGQSVSSWAINWGDGSAVQNVAGNTTSLTHTFTIAGGYTISATATDSGGTWNSNNKSVTASALPVFTIAGAGSVYEQTPYTLSLAASDTKTVNSWTINWGDGSTFQAVSGNPSSVVHTYPAGPGSFTIFAWATDNNATYQALNSVAVDVLHAAPAAVVSGASSVVVNSTYTLGLSVSDPGHTISGWSIDWGDGGGPTSVIGNPETVSHAYLATGNYTIHASVIDDVSTYAANALAVAVTPVPDVTAPTASATLAALTSVGQSGYTFSVTYHDDRAVSLASLGDHNLVVSGPGGFSRPAVLESASPAADAGTIIATYQVAAPAGTWSFADNGTYTLTLLGNQVSDTSGNPAAPGTLGTFLVAVPPAALPLGNWTAKGRHNAAGTFAAGGGNRFYTFTLGSAETLKLQFTDQQAGLNLSLIDSNFNPLVSRHLGKKTVSLTMTLKAGTYYLDLGSYAARAGKYQLAITASAVASAAKVVRRAG